MKQSQGFLIGVVLLTLSSMTPGQITEVIRKTDILSDPNNAKSVIGRVYPGTEIKKVGRDESGKYIKATFEFYIPLETLKEGRIAKQVGESQIADNATVKLVTASYNEHQVNLVLEITNNGTKDMDMSALLLCKLTDRKGNLGNLEFMESKNSVGIIGPGKTLRSELIYSFEKTAKDVELTFQSKLGGDQVFFLLGF